MTCKDKNEPLNKIKTHISLHNNSLPWMEVGFPSTFPGAKNDYLEDSIGMQTRQDQYPTCLLPTLYAVVQATKEINLKHVKDT